LRFGVKKTKLIDAVDYDIANVSYAWQDGESLFTH